MAARGTTENTAHTCTLFLILRAQKLHGSHSHAWDMQLIGPVKAAAAAAAAAGETSILNVASGFGGIIH